VGLVTATKEEERKEKSLPERDWTVDNPRLAGLDAVHGDGDFVVVVVVRRPPAAN